MRRILKTSFKYLLMVLIGTTTLATHAHAERQVGVIGGFNVAGVWGNEAGGTGYRNGGMTGLVFLRRISDNTFLRAEVAYSQKGTEADLYTGEGYETVTGELEYIDIPLLLEISLAPGKDGSPYFLMGPMTSINLSAKATVAGNKVDVSNVNKTDFSIVGGFGLGFGAPKRSFMIEMRYALGLFQIFKDVTANEAAAALNRGEIPIAWPDTGRGLEYNNAVLSFTVGMMF